MLSVTTKVRCPHCGKNLLVSLDLSGPEETWLEDCQLCKQAIHFSSTVKDDRIAVKAEQPAGS
jgi:transcription elongation factor Elf1